MSAAVKKTPPLDLPLAFTFFPDWKANEKQEASLSLKDAAARILSASRASKEALPWLKLARFGDTRTEKGSLRHNANVLAISGIEGDYDNETLTVDEAAQILATANLAAMVYTSPSHTEDTPRWRVLCPLSHEYSPAERDALIARLNGVFHGGLSGESHTLSQSYYYGSVKRSPSHRVVLVDGAFLDQRLDLDDGAIGRAKEVPPAIRSDTPRTAVSSAFIESVIRNSLAKVAGAGDGQKHHTLRAQAKVLGGYHHLHAYSKTDAVQWLVNALPYTAKDLKAAAATAAWGFEWGQAHPLDVPPPKNNVVPFSIPEPPPYESIPDEPDPEAPPVIPLPTPPAALVWFDDIQPCLDTLDFVEGVLIEGGAGVVYGESNAGKTFWTTDLALHVAAGMPWNGREVDQGGVVYCVLEGGIAFNNRVAAWREQRGVSGIPFAARQSSLNLLDPSADLDALVDTINEASRSLPVPVKLVVIDTLARAFAGGNENASEDMGALVMNMDRLRRETGSCVLFVHHSGKDAAKGARGHSSLRAALDTEIEVVASEETDAKTATVVKQRDLPKGGVFGFRLDVATIGRNRRGKDVTTCIVVPVADALPIARRTRKASHNETLALRALDKALNTAGAFLPPSPDYPPKTWATSQEAWRGEFYQLHGDDKDAARVAFNRGKTALIDGQVIGQRNGFVWREKGLKQE